MEGGPSSSSSSLLAASASPSTCLTEAFDVVLPKKYVNMYAISALEQRVLKLGTATPGLVRYQPYNKSGGGAAGSGGGSSGIVAVSPLYVTVKAEPAAKQLYKGSLRELQRPLADDEAFHELTRMARIMLNLHRHGIVHGRLTLSSWREDDNNSLFLVDAVVPIAVMPPSAPLLKTVAHLLAPEVVAAAGGGEGAAKEQMISPAADVWGLAVCYLQLVLQDKAFNTLERMDIIDAGIMCPLINNLPPQIVSVLVRCLKQEPQGRPQLEELYCELTGQPTARQNAVMMAMMQDGGSSDDEEDDDEEEEDDDEEDEDDEDEA